MNDLRFALRQLRKSSGFTAVAVLTVAIGVGANTAIFSLMNAVVLQPLPWRDPERLVQIMKSASWHGAFPLVGREELIAWQRGNPVLEQVAPYAPGWANWSGGGEAMRISLLKASAELLPMLGVRPILGRTFLPEEDRWGGPPVAVVTHAFWQRQLAGAQEVIGRTITLDNRSFTVIGVLPDGFQFPGDYTVMVPLAMGTLPAREHFRLTGTIDQLRAIGRLRTGVTLDRAAAALDAIYQGVRDPEDKGHVSLVDLRQHVLGAHAHNLRLLFWIAAFVLLIVCANVANLLLARAAGRRKEMGIRVSLGAGRGRIVRQLLTESVVLALLGGVLGLGVAHWGLRLLQPLLAFLPKLRTVGIDGWAFAFMFLTALLVGVAFGLAPALTVARVSPLAALSSGGRGPCGGTPRRRLQEIFVVVQVAVALVLLLGTCLFVLSMAQFLRHEPGFDTDRLLSFKVTLSPPRYAEEPSQVTFFQQVLDAVRSLPGVEATGIGSGLPLDGNAGAGLLTTTLPGRGNKQIQANYTLIDAGYFGIVGLRMKQGRAFTAQDRQGSPEVALVNEAFVRTYLHDQEPLGQAILFGKGAPAIVGVTADVRAHPDDKVSPMIYLPFPQHAGGTMALMVRTRGDPLALVGGIRQRVAEIDPTQPLDDVRTMKQRWADRVAFERIFLGFSVVFAAVAVLLAGLGIHGVIAYAVTQRTNEIGIRMALGARSGDVLRLVIVQGLLLAAGGTGVGLLGGLGLTQVIFREMYGMTTRNPWMFAATAAFMMIIALLACWMPARRAARVDPMVALRCE